jgi:hypothetical protein
VNPKDNLLKQKHEGAETQARREFLKKIGKGSATVPAAVLLLAAANANKAQAGVSGSCGCGCGCGCDGSS